ncbi:MAG TPA: hypothetical protein VII58_05795 [Acidobacteriaceae bacterium]
MASSKDIQETKKICAGIRQFNKELLDHLYTQAAETGRYPSPDKAINELYRLVKVAILGNLPPLSLAMFQRSIMRDQDVIDMEAVLGARLFRDTYHDAVDAYFRHRPGLEIKKGKPGRKPNVVLAKRIWALKAEGRTNREIQETLNASGENRSLEAYEAYLKKRRRARKQ